MLEWWLGRRNHVEHHAGFLDTLAIGHQHGPRLFTITDCP